MKMLLFSTKRLRNSKRLQYHTECLDLYNDDRFEAIKAKVEQLLAGYAASHAIAESGFKKEVRSVFTQKMMGSDDKRDSVIKSMRGIVVANTKNFDPEVKDAAERVLVVFDTYKNIARKSLDEETAEVSNMLYDLTTKYAEYIKLAGIEEWVPQLKKFNDEFDTLNKSRDNETAKRSPIVLKNILDELDTKNEKLATRISALAEVEGLAAYNDFIVRMNVITGRYSKKSAKSNSNETPEGDSEPVDYPDAKEWEEDLPFQGVENGDIYYILVDGKKVFYKLVDKQKFFWHPESEKAAGGWEKLD